LFSVEAVPGRIARRRCWPPAVYLTLKVGAGCPGLLWKPNDTRSTSTARARRGNRDDRRCEHQRRQETQQAGGQAGRQAGRQAAAKQRHIAAQGAEASKQLHRGRRMRLTAAAVPCNRAASLPACQPANLPSMPTCEEQALVFHAALCQDPLPHARAILFRAPAVCAGAAGLQRQHGWSTAVSQLRHRHNINRRAWVLARSWRRPGFFLKALYQAPKLVSAIRYPPDSG